VLQLTDPILVGPAGGGVEHLAGIALGHSCADQSPTWPGRPGSPRCDVVDTGFFRCYRLQA
jgi:hypothetical protein